MHRRRFVNMVVDFTSLAGDHRGYALHRISVADLFHRGRARCQHAADDMEMEDAVLPLPAMVFHTTRGSSDDAMYFLPLASSGDGSEVSISGRLRSQKGKWKGAKVAGLSFLGFPRVVVWGCTG
ncbi:hypothetical protein ACP4OV_022631 [Aristida adscensionis]